MRRREPSEEEVALWNEHTGADKKLLGKKPAPEPAKKQLIVKEKTPPARTRLKEAKALRFLEAGSMQDLDARNAERLKKGAKPVDAKLDLHGMTREAAFVAFHDFILSQYESGRRNLLIVTGKGEKGQGVLRQSLPGWINDPAVRSCILAYDKAQIRHGGDGAFYLLLKKRK